MSAVGLLLPGWASPREAAPMTLLVGALQVSTPTTLIIMGIADARTVFTASGLYLLGFTYLKGNQRRDQLERTGPGWLGLFVAHRCRGLLPVAGRRVGSCATEGVIA